ncbi:DNA cytosine methyltransferase [Bacillus sp. BP-3]|uniref:DNA cytosine methyltransferase n=1 Tax=Bacillus sp. BP-3 TaxID=3022773 RepID=UPI00232AD90D|nr:DNA cytosine methyltransferase [Bacillus sp. BP-3]MDC2863502.1 DNA cytosine methyltransferase [Bacillus sp. BP-3]
MSSFTFIDLFAGMGGIRIPFDRLDGNCVFSSEWDKFAQQTYEANFGEVPHGDICEISTEDIPDHDILLGGFPCQAFSVMGNRLGFADTRGTLFFEIERILKAKKPRAFLLENVKQLRGHDKGRTLQVILSKLDELGYKVKYEILNALNFGLPQKRERIIIVGFLDHSIEFEFPKVSNIKVDLADILEPDELVDKKYFASEEIVKSRLEKVQGKYIPVPAIWHENKAGDVGVNEFSCALRAGASYNYLLVNGKRRLTPRELLRLQGFPEDYKIVVSDQQIRKQTGNSVSIPVIQAVANEMLKCMREHNLLCDNRINTQKNNEEQLTLVI